MVEGVRMWEFQCLGGAAPARWTAQLGLCPFWTIMCGRNYDFLCEWCKTERKWVVIQPNVRDFYSYGFVMVHENAFFTKKWTIMGISDPLTLFFTHIRANNQRKQRHKNKHSQWCSHRRLPRELCWKLKQNVCRKIIVKMGSKIVWSEWWLDCTHTQVVGCGISP